MDWKEYLYRRVLLRLNHYWCPTLIEAVPIEVSPEGRVKFEWKSGNSTWESKDKYDLIEVLDR